MPVTLHKMRLGSRGTPEKTRAAILDAAMNEFAREGVAGARTDEIARAAGVNKALLYYYFRDKETLYGAVLDRVFSGLAQRVMQVLDRDLPPGEKILLYAATHFDYIASLPHTLPRVVQYETMRSGRNASPHMKRIVERYFKPLFARLAEVIQEGIACGEFRSFNVRHFILSIIALNVFYFNSAGVFRLFGVKDPFSPEQIAERRAAALDFISAALFRRRSGDEPVQPGVKA